MFITIKNNGKTRTWTCFGEISPNNMLLCCLCNRISALFTRMSEKEVLHVGRRPRGLVIDLDIFTSKKTAVSLVTAVAPMQVPNCGLCNAKLHHPHF